MLAFDLGYFAAHLHPLNLPYDAEEWSLLYSPKETSKGIVDNVMEGLRGNESKLVKTRNIQEILETRAGVSRESLDTYSRSVINAVTFTEQ